MKVLIQKDLEADATMELWKNGIGVYVGTPISLRATCAGIFCYHQQINYWYGKGEHKKHSYGWYNNTDSRSSIFLQNDFDVLKYSIFSDSIQAHALFVSNKNINVSISKMIFLLIHIFSIRLYPAKYFEFVELYWEKLFCFLLSTTMVDSNSTWLVLYKIGTLHKRQRDTSRSKFFRNKVISFSPDITTGINRVTANDVNYP